MKFSNNSEKLNKAEVEKHISKINNNFKILLQKHRAISNKDDKRVLYQKFWEEIRKNICSYYIIEYESNFKTLINECSNLNIKELSRLKLQVAQDIAISDSFTHNLSQALKTMYLSVAITILFIFVGIQLAISCHDDYVKKILRSCNFFLLCHFIWIDYGQHNLYL